MGTDEPGRPNSAVIGAAGAAVLAAGIWWWTASTPAPLEPEPASSSPSLRVVVPDESDVPNDAGNESDVRNESETVELPDVDKALPRLPGTVRREVTTLAPDATLDWAIGSEKGERYLLQYVCVGSGDLKISVRGSVGGDRAVGVRCQHGLQSSQIQSRGGELVISARHPGRAAGKIGVQLVAL